MRRGHNLPTQKQVEGELYYPGISEYETDTHRVKVWDETDDNGEPNLVMAVYAKFSMDRAYESFHNLCGAAKAFVEECEKHYKEDRTREEIEADDWAEWGDLQRDGGEGT